MGVNLFQYKTANGVEVTASTIMSECEIDLKRVTLEDFLTSHITWLRGYFILSDAYFVQIRLLILAFLKYSSYICNEITNQETMNMENLNERAANYAVEKTNELLAKAIAQAYKDGYNNGYKECADDHDIDLYVDVDFVDLDLPSGLLWSSRYRMGEEDKPLILTYEEASTMDIPTEEQVIELVNYCNWQHIMGYVGRGGYDIRQPVGKYCNSVNGKRISFYDEGMKYIGSNYVPHGIRFWIRDDVDEAEKKSVFIESSLQNEKPIIIIEKVDASTAKMPVMLVRNK